MTGPFITGLFTEKLPGLSNPETLGDSRLWILWENHFKIFTTFFSFIISQSPQLVKMSLYSDDRRKRKWDNQDSSPRKSRRDHDEHDRFDRDRDNYDQSSRHEDRHGSHRDRDGRHGDRRSSSPQPSREPRKHSSSSRAPSAPLDPAAAAGPFPLHFPMYFTNVQRLQRLGFLLV